MTDEGRVPPAEAAGRPGVLVLSLHYAPEPNFIVTDVAESLLPDARVTVVCPFPNYPYAKWYDGQRHWWPRKSVERGVTVWRVPMFLDHSQSKLRRFAAYMSFSLWAAVTALFVGGMPRVVWVYQTPFTTAIGALWFKLVARARVVYTYADLWPESFIAAAVAKPGPLLELMYATRRLLNRAAHTIIGSTRGTVAKFRADGVPEERLHFIPVWIPGATGAPPAPAAAGTPAVVYAGSLGPAQPLEGLVRAFAMLHAEGVDVRFDVYGTGTQDEPLRALARELGAPNVVFHGRVAPEVAYAASAAALAQVIVLRPDPLFAMTIPSKLLFSFGAGAPLLYALHGEAAALAAESGAGFAFDAADPATAVAQVRALLAQPAAAREAQRERLRRFYAENFAPALLLRRYRALLLPGGTTGEPVHMTGSRP